MVSKFIRDKEYPKSADDCNPFRLGVFPRRDQGMNDPAQMQPRSYPSTIWISLTAFSRLGVLAPDSSSYA